MSKWFFGALAIVALVPAVAMADAGAVRASERHGNRQITIFTDPTPLRAGPVDVSVLVQDVTTGEVLLSDTIDIEVAPQSLPSSLVLYRATSAAASNKLFQAAKLDLPEPGWWDLSVTVCDSEVQVRIPVR